MARGRARKAILVAGLALAVGVGVGVALVTGNHSTPSEPGTLLIRLDDRTDTVDVFGLDGSLQRTVLLPEGTIDGLVGSPISIEFRTLVFWNEDTKLLTRVDPTSGDVSTLEVAAIPSPSLAFMTSAGVLVLQHPGQPVSLVDTTSMRVIDTAARFPGLVLRDVLTPLEIDGSTLLIVDDPAGMVVFPADTPSKPWFAEGLVVDYSAAGAVSWDPSADTVRLLTADGQVGKTITLSLGDDEQVNQWSANAFVVSVKGQQSLWRLDFDAGSASPAMDLPMGETTLLPHDRLFVLNGQDRTAVLYDLSGAVLATFRADVGVEGSGPADLGDWGSDCRTLGFADNDAPSELLWTTAVMDLESGKFLATVPGGADWRSSDGCSVRTNDGTGTHIVHAGRTTDLADDIALNLELGWAVDRTDDGDWLVELATGKQIALPPGDGGYMFVGPATAEAQHAT